MSPALESGEDTREMPDSIETFPTQNQPVMDTVLKDMLMSLRSTIQTDMASCMSRFTKDIQAIGDRVDHVEVKMYAHTINDLVDAYEEKEGENEWIKAKLADLEARSRLKIRGIPESTLFKNLIPGLTDLVVTIDRIHRLPKPSHLSDHIPRDVLLRLHFFPVKENLMQYMRKQEQLPPTYQNLQFFADLSQYTLLKRKNLNTVAKVLRNHKIPYRWGYPTKITVTRENRTYVISSLDKGLAILREWDIRLESDEVNPTTSTPHQIDGEWKEVTAKNAKSHV